MAVSDCPCPVSAEVPQVDGGLALRLQMGEVGGRLPSSLISITCMSVSDLHVESIVLCSGFLNSWHLD